MCYCWREVHNIHYSTKNTILILHLTLQSWLSAICCLHRDSCNWNWTKTELQGILSMFAVVAMAKACIVLCNHYSILPDRLVSSLAVGHSGKRIVKVLYACACATVEKLAITRRKTDIAPTSNQNIQTNVHDICSILASTISLWNVSKPHDTHIRSTQQLESFAVLCVSLTNNAIGVNGVVDDLAISCSLGSDRLGEAFGWCTGPPSAVVCPQLLVRILLLVQHFHTLQFTHTLLHHSDHGMQSDQQPPMSLIFLLKVNLYSVLSWSHEIISNMLLSQTERACSL